MPRPWIAYFIFPEHEGHDIATSMAEKLVALAFANGASRITAQTLPEPTASTRILEKLGFSLAGSIIHPEDGKVWEWQLRA
ncbi:MAG: GNAT family N-acetyltransferase [Lautropia sp.]